ncbi:mitotic checkpoint regulator, MAD2B-interacting-domain-containing protein [Pseudomassariella vexata]|uniref:Mitotic checkpoint regulator, MAD2B-interacting-domain-containing protein n=1 Tax=Pseudomassariella vexata TaxID=1141098 RepID=A0A1Y2DIV2_9PEZI|nr:mitotic checkpoint regulator, MAD2B-interacting-domain-containing protein [Pseudomassariella vexata]ORY59106.1 mitotic checkpoint regulator, MAD2B-interacting-domain-containing protein [Pseudomassariella vexata]
MALVDYSDSESDSETVLKPEPTPQAPTASATTAKKPIQKVVDRANPRKILVNLSGRSVLEKATPKAGEEPPAKRKRTAGGAFSGFNSLLPAPKNAGKPATASSSGKNAPRPGVNLKTGAAPGFSRNNDEDGMDGESLNGQPAQQPSIPEGQKPADEVKLVGKPLMFKPLSVSRKPAKKKATSVVKAPPKSSTPATMPVSQPESPMEELAKKKVSLFSISDEPSEPTPIDPSPSNGTYEPMFPTSSGQHDSFADYDAQFASSYSHSQSQLQPTASTDESLDSIASSMNLSATARRELFGRRGAPGSAQSAARVINFNTDDEYKHNEELRAAGEQQIHNPVRAIAPGKHNLRQLVNQVQNQREALEESFAQGRNNRNEAGAKYGWR